MYKTTANRHALIGFTKLASTVVLTSSLAGCLWDPWGWNGNGSNTPIDSNNAPTFTSAASISVPEGTAANIYTASAEDIDGDILVFGLAGGSDQAAFNIDSATGALSFVVQPDFESPADSDRNNEYVVDLSVDDSNGATTYLTLAVAVANRNEAPIFTSALSKSVYENSSAGYIASAVDPELDDVVFGIVGGADQAIFNIDSLSGHLDFNSPPDFEAPGDSDADNVYVVELGADDGNGATSRMTFTITILDASQLEIQVSFPTPNSNLGSVTDTIVTGNLIDIEDGNVEFDDVSLIDVNGMTASLSLDNPGRWSVLIPAGAPNDSLMILADAVGGGLSTASLQIENNALILRPDLLEIDTSNNRLLVGDNGGFGALIAVDLTSGARTIIEDANTGTGPQIILPEASALDVDNDRILIVDSYLNALISLDLSSGNRTSISDTSTGSGPTFGWPLSITLDPANNRAFVVDADLEALLAVDLTTGNRTIVSDATLGTGPAFSFPTVTVFDARNNRVLVADAGLEALISVDPTNGGRSIVADGNSGAGLNLPTSMVLDVGTDTVLVGDAFEQAVISIDLSDGAGTVLSDAVIGLGPLLSYPSAIVLDTSNNRALVVDIDLGLILTVDLSNGDRSEFDGTDMGIGDGPRLLDGTAVATHSESNRVLIGVQANDGAGLVWVDLESGNRSTLADTNRGNGPVLDDPNAIALDVENNQALVLDYTLNALVSVNLTNGDRTIISDQNMGSGTPFVAPVSVALDSANNRALVLDDGLDALISTDLSDGNRVVIADASAGAGPNITSPTSVVLDEDNNRALVLDYDLSALVSIDLVSGNRTVISDDATGIGPEFFGPRSVALDSENNRVLVSDGSFPSDLFWVNLVSGDRSIIEINDDSSPMLLDVPSLVIDHANSRALAMDAEVDGLIVVELTSGQTALASR